MEKKNIKDILESYSSGAFTAEQEEAVRLWLFQLHQDDETGLSELDLNNASQKIWSRLETIRPQPVKVVRLWPRIAVAASIIFALAASVFFYVDRSKTGTVPTADYTNDVAPGRQGATLTLANGKKIRLTNAANGELAKEAGVVITKSANGELIYEIKDTHAESNKINVLSTAKGETYQLRLPDGSLVWLNAASSLTYSANLNERGKRRVRLEGEGYFEIAKDKAHPFIVESSGQQVEVLGTHFNISSYKDEKSIKTTLLEGKVKVSTANIQRILSPGEQVRNTDGAIEVNKVDADAVIDWKNGLFVFNDEPLEDIMRKLSRWYDVDVVYQGIDPRSSFYGSMSRYDHISKVLSKLELTGDIHFKIEGRTIRVSK